MNPRTQLFCILQAGTADFKDHLPLLKDVDLSETSVCAEWHPKEPVTLIRYASILKRWDAVYEIAKFKKADEEDSGHYAGALLNLVWGHKVRGTEEEEKKINKALLALLEAGAKLHWRMDENTLLHLAVINRNPQMLGSLVLYGCDGGRLNSDKKTPLELAVELGAWDCAEVLVPGSRKNNRKNTLESMLLTAIKAGKFNFVMLLLEEGTDWLNDPTKKGEEGCLHAAVRAASQNPEKGVPLLHLLLRNLRHNEENILYLGKKNKTGQTPIELAYDLGLFSCVEMIAGAIGPEVTQQCEYGFENVLFKAAANKKNDIVNAIARAGNPEGYEVTLRSAVVHDCYMAADALLKAKVKPTICNAPQRQGDTLAHVAVKKNDPRMLAILYSNNVDLEVKHVNSHLDPKTLAVKLHGEHPKEGFNYLMQKTLEMAEVNKCAFFQLIKAYHAPGKGNVFAKCAPVEFQKILSFLDNRPFVTVRGSENRLAETVEEYKAKKTRVRAQVTAFLASYDKQFFHSSGSKTFTDELRNILQTSQNFLKDVAQAVAKFEKKQKGKNVNTISLLVQHGLIKGEAAGQQHVTIYAPSK
ncbi:MAG TPA: ankyrin repeat domain-containing protein [Gammaproteobacteria bacterium]|nr:ankyrin repeat domain-containing protein [Gammaproteobacteria bacterium]